SLAGTMVQSCWGRAVNIGLADALQQHAELEAIVAEDERYMEELEKKEEEALRQKAAAMAAAAAEAEPPGPAPARAPAPKPATAAAPSAPSRSRSRSRCATESGTGTGTSETCPTGTPSPIGFPAIGQRNGWLDLVARMGPSQAAQFIAGLLRPSPNGDPTDGA